MGRSARLALPRPRNKYFLPPCSDGSGAGQLSRKDVQSWKGEWEWEEGCGNGADGEGC